MDKVFHVFVSSTYTDLKEERKKVSESVAKAGYVAEGMEIFPASSQNQMDFIQRVIDRCDYYILIIGGRYGSLAPDGLSFTEKEFNYAKDKGIPILAIIYEDIESLPEEKREESEEKQQKLKLFTDSILSSSVVDYWTNPDELAKNALAALSQAKVSHPGIGWVRANNAASVDVLSDINELRKENAKLETKFQIQNKNNHLIDEMELADLDEEIKLHFELTKYHEESAHLSMSTCWKDILTTIGPTFRTYSKIDEARASLAELISSKYNHQYSASSIKIKTSSLETIFFQFEALGLIQMMESIPDSVLSSANYKLTGKGLKILMKEKIVVSQTPK